MTKVNINKSIRARLSDAEFFEKYCRSVHIVFNYGEEQMVFIKDEKYEMAYTSLAYRNAFHSENLAQALNTDSDAYLQETAIIKEQDEQIRQSLQSQTFLYIDDYQHISHVYKRPIINPYTNNFIGIIGIVEHLLLPNVLKLIYKINNIPLATPSVKKLNYKLTERQAMVLFLSVNKYSSTEIADIMTVIGYKISRSRVNGHLENLKYIFQVKTKEELLERAVGMNYHLSIPRQFLKVGSYKFDDELVIYSNQKQGLAMLNQTAIS